MINYKEEVLNHFPFATCKESFFSPYKYYIDLNPGNTIPPYSDYYSTSDIEEEAWTRSYYFLSAMNMI